MYYDTFIKCLFHSIYMKCFFCKKDIWYSGDSELLLHPGKEWKQVSVCNKCLTNLPKWKQERYKLEKWKNYTKEWDVYLRWIKPGEKIHTFRNRKDL